MKKKIATKKSAPTLIARIEEATGADRCDKRRDHLGGTTYERALLRASQRAHAVYPDDDGRTVAFGVIRFAIYAGVTPSQEDRDRLEKAVEDAKN